MDQEKEIETGTRDKIQQHLVRGHGFNPYNLGVSTASLLGTHTDGHAPERNPNHCHLGFKPASEMHWSGRPSEKAVEENPGLPTEQQPT